MEENACKSYLTKDLYSEYITNPYNSIIKISQLKMGKGYDGQFSAEDIQMANMHMKRYSTSLVIREIQIKTTMRNYIIPTRLAIINMIESSKYW